MKNDLYVILKRVKKMKKSETGRRNKNREVSSVKKTVLISILLVISFTLFAGGSKETESEEAENREPADMTAINTIPEIQPIPLKSGEKLQLVATTNIIGDVLSHVAGDAADTTVLMVPGESPHTFEPVPGDLRTIERADIIFVNGFNLEENLLDDIHAAAKGYIVPVSSGIRSLDFATGSERPTGAAGSTTKAGGSKGAKGSQGSRKGGGSKGAAIKQSPGDPHVWMNPNNVIRWVKNMTAVLSSADPDQAEIYRKNGEAYIAELVEMDRYMREQLESIPKEKRVLILDHQLFNYFAGEYGFTVIGTLIPGTTDNAEPSPKAITELVKLIREYHVPALFVGRTASDGLQKLAKTIIAETGTNVKIVSTLTGSLAPAGERGDTYLDFLRYNIEQIVKGLGE